MILFSVLIYIPKVLFHGGSLNIESFFLNIFGGVSYWFTSSLAVAQILTQTVAYAIKSKSMWVYVGITSLLFILGLYLNNNRIGSEPEDFFPWFYMTGFEYTLIMAIGGLYLVYEQHKRVFRFGVIFALLAYIVPLISSFYTHQNLQMLGLSGQCNVGGLICSIGGVYLIVALCKKMKRNRMLSYIGQNSIIYYFLSGVLPASIGSLAIRFSPEYNYMVVVAIAIISLLLASMITYVIVRFLPFMVDIRKLGKP